MKKKYFVFKDRIGHKYIKQYIIGGTAFIGLAGALLFSQPAKSDIILRVNSEALFPIALKGVGSKKFATINGVDIERSKVGFGVGAAFGFDLGGAQLLATYDYLQNAFPSKENIEKAVRQEKRSHDQISTHVIGADLGYRFGEDLGFTLAGGYGYGMTRVKGIEDVPDTNFAQHMATARIELDYTIISLVRLGIYSKYYYNFGFKNATIDVPANHSVSVGGSVALTF